MEYYQERSGTKEVSALPEKRKVQEASKRRGRMRFG